jgi:hypothetical protein
MAQDIIAAGADPAPRHDPLDLDGILPPELSFTPVTTKSGRQKFLPELQRKFIQALSITGSVTLSARAVGMSIGQVYGVKNGPRAESFGTAWEKAIQIGGYRARDTIVDHAINGTPEYFYKDGQLVGERRHFNLRAMQWVVTHVLPHLGEGAGGLSAQGVMPASLKKLKEAWRAECRKEWEEEVAAQEAELLARYQAEQESASATQARFLKKYEGKVREEYYFRAEGNSIAADFALRQLALLEVVMDVGGISHDLIRDHFHNAPYGGPWSTKISRARDAQDALPALPAPEAQHAPDSAAPAPAEAYARPRRPFYLNEEDMVKDEVARTRLNWLAGGQRERAAAQAEWRANRRTQSEKPGEGDTFLPEG